MNRTCVFTITTALLCLPLVISLCTDPNCAVCSTAGNNCNECEHGFTVKNNKCSHCPTNCLTCTVDDYCQSCSTGFWGYQCLYKCPSNCDEAGCDKISGYCFNCEIGWYGLQCQQECNRCENAQCDLRNCSTGCKDGYFQEIYNNVSDCILCLPFCKKCSNNTFCTQCYSGHYIYQYTAAAVIVATCLNCSSTVPKCVECTFDKNQVSCGSCEAGYAVNQYNQCVINVVCPHCQNGCDSVGLCSGSCQPGWTGIRCNVMCNTACNTCSNQDACLSCKDDFYTQTCNVACNTNCQSGNYPRCRFSDGYCSNGCNKGFWGNQCEYNCNNNCLDITTASELCHRNGTCYYGCKAGYMGSDCSQVSSTSPSPFISTTTITTSTDKTNQISVTTHVATAQSPKGVPSKNEQPVAAIGGGAGGGVALVVVVVVVFVICLLKRRSLQKQKDQAQSTNMYYNVSMDASHEEQSQPERQLDKNDIQFASSSSQCEAALYEKLSEQNKGNLYDHLDQPYENGVRKEVEKLRSNVEYYNN